MKMGRVNDNSAEKKQIHKIESMSKELKRATTTTNMHNKRY